MAAAQALDSLCFFLLKRNFFCLHETYKAKENTITKNIVQHVQC